MKQDNIEKKIIIICPNEKCLRKLRIPKSPRPLMLSCPKCGIRFTVPYKNVKEKGFVFFVNKIKKHPIIFGLLVTLWFLLEGTMYKWRTISLKGSLYVTALCVGLWFLATWVIENFKEKDTKWYYRKWIVLFMLIFIPPLGITLLWAGSKFRITTKIAFTIGFGLWFIGSVLTKTTGRFYFTPEERIISLISSPKENIFLEKAGDSVKAYFQNKILKSQIIKFKGIELTIPQIAQKWGDSIVLVKSKDKNGNEISQGSGFVVTRDGGIVTNYHVVELAYTVTIGLSDGKTYNNVIFIAGDSSKDIAVLAVDGRDEEFTPLILGNSDSLTVGEQVLAIGNPYGWRNTLSDGLISGIREIEGFRLLQITAPISPGSSGGALFNMKGEVIGITTIASLWGAQNLNFAIPINSFKSFIKNWSMK